MSEIRSGTDSEMLCHILFSLMYSSCHSHSSSLLLSPPNTFGILLSVSIAPTIHHHLVFASQGQPIVFFTHLLLFNFILF